MSNIEQIKDISDLEKKLSESDVLRYRKFSNKIRKLQYLLSRAIVRDVCKQNITVQPNGVPTIKNGFISIAHKDNWVVVAVSDMPVGLDIENTDIKRDFMEQSKLLELPQTDDKNTFYKNFTTYESEFKFGDGAKSANKYFYEFDNYLICICTNERKSDIQFVSLSAKQKQ